MKQDTFLKMAEADLRMKQAFEAIRLCPPEVRVAFTTFGALLSMLTRDEWDRMMGPEAETASVDKEANHE